MCIGLCLTRDGQEFHTRSVKSSPSRRGLGAEVFMAELEEAVCTSTTIDEVESPDDGEDFSRKMVTFGDCVLYSNEDVKTILTGGGIWNQSH